MLDTGMAGSKAAAVPPYLPRRSPSRAAGRLWILLVLIIGPCLVAGTVRGKPAAPGPSDQQRSWSAVEAVLSRADSLLAADQPARARELADSLGRRWGDDPLYGWQVEARVGLALLRLDDPAAAVPHLEDAVRSAPWVPANHVNLAVALLALNRPGRAVGEYQSAVELDSTQWRARLDLGQALLALGLRRSARIHLEAASKLCGGCPEAQQALAELHLQAGEQDAAAAALQKANQGRLTAAERLRLAAAYQHGGHEEQMRDLLAPLWPLQLTVAARQQLLRADLALADTVRAAWLVRSLASAGRSSGDWADDPVLWALASRVLQEAGDPESALRAIEEAIRLAPADAVYQNNRVVLLQELGRTEEAQQAWQRLQGMEGKASGD
jgi:tetratricopeptide (TPR) repeat protein